jgi:integrase
MKRHRNGGLRKACGCPRRKWPKCGHSWHFNFKVRGGQNYRFSVDVEAGKHIESKTDAEALADKWRSAIREGTFRRRADVPAPAAAPSTPDTITLADFGRTYFERRGKPVSANDRSSLVRLSAFAPEGQRPLGETPIGAITEDAIELFFAQLRNEGRAASTRNKYVGLVKAMFRWAVKKGYLARNPVADSEGIRREKHAKRNRRLAPDVFDDAGKIVREGEERRLLAVAGPHLQRLIIGALETGCRRGELLNLRWQDVNLGRREITVRAEITKTRTHRALPISSRLAAVLEMARTQLVAFLSGDGHARLSDQERAALVARSFVFGDAAGFRVRNVKKAWEVAILKAHGHGPEWTDTKLSAMSRAALKAIDLHFHDLRHEAGSRLLEAGWPLHHVQEMLGHANVSQTSTYLNATRIGLQDSMRRFDDSSARCKPVANEAQIAPTLPCNDDVSRPGKSLVN